MRDEWGRRVGMGRNRRRWELGGTFDPGGGIRATGRLWPDKFLQVVHTDVFKYFTNMRTYVHITSHIIISSHMLHIYIYIYQ